MLVYNKKKPSFFKIALLLLVIVVLIFPKEKSYYTNLKVSLMDKISTYDLGYSQLYGIFDNNDFFTLSKSIKFSDAPNIILNFFTSVKRAVEIPNISIDIKFKNYQKILKDRESAAARRLGHDFKEVNGVISYNGKKMKAKIRLKGDLIDHWGSKYRLSLRVKLKNGNSLLGLTEFSLQKTQTRLFPYDQSFQDAQKLIGNISSVHDYVNVTLNGQSWGVMNIEEHTNKEFLEKQKLKESLIFKFGNQDDWLYSNNNEYIYKNYLLSDTYLNVNIYNQKKYLETTELYRKWYSYVAKEHLKFESNIYDNDSFSTSLIFSLIWNNDHTLFDNNSKYYFNPYELKLEPITTDQSVFSPSNERFNLPEPYIKIVNNEKFEKRFDQNLQKVKYNITKLDSIFNKWSKYFPLDDKLNSEIIKLNAEKIKNIKTFKNLIKKDNNFEVDDLNLSKSQNLFDHIHARHFDNGEIHIYNLLNEKITIDIISHDNQTLDGYSGLIVEPHRYNYKPTIIYSNLLGIQDGLIDIETNHLDIKRKFKIDFTHITKGLKNPFNNKTSLTSLNFIESYDSLNIYVKKGKWYVDKPLVLEKNLIIKGGTELIFSLNSYIILNGSSLIINGTKEERVILRSNKTYWKGLYIKNSPQKSYLKNLLISNTTNLSDNLLNLTGAINFYKSDVELINVEFKSTIAEDFLNIVHSNFSMDSVIFNQTISDGFDSDFSVGKISNSSFYNIKGDALDFSGSTIEIENTFFKNVTDKAISAGESSNVKVNKVKADSIGVGLASKDGSQVEIVNTNFSNFKLHALMTYQKKSFYKKSSIKANKILFDNSVNSCFRQYESQMTLDGKNILEKFIDVDSLYQKTIMKK